ncbi:MAG: hypothetical protein RI885_1147 [Actinomycetota bacterium]|jgi:SAM-dependent methyltransferase
MSERRRERYTHGHHESVLRAHSWRTVENSAAYLVPHLAPGLAVLDVGCGPGTITLDLAERVVPGRVVGMDAGSDVLVGARTLAHDRGLAHVEFVVGDAYALDFADDSFDIVHAHQVLQHVSDPVAVLQEMARVARPGGLVAARDVDYAAAVWYPASEGLDRWMQLYQAVHRVNGGEPDAGRRLRRWALAAGLDEVTSSASIWCFASAEDRDWWGGAWAVRSLESDFATSALESGLATRADLEHISAAWLDWAASDDGVLMMSHGEVLGRVPLRE